MQVLFESRDPEGARMRDLSVRRALAWLVPHASVRLSDDHGPRGGADKRCRVELSTHSLGTVVITAVARDWRSALDAALARAARVLVRAWRRGRDHGRIPRPALGFDR
jgi:hypothetical protein